jgi:hypothetical protein
MLNALHTLITLNNTISISHLFLLLYCDVLPGSIKNRLISSDPDRLNGDGSMVKGCTTATGSACLQPPATPVPTYARKVSLSVVLYASLGPPSSTSMTVYSSVGQSVICFHVIWSRSVLFSDGWGNSVCSTNRRFICSTKPGNC